MQLVWDVIVVVVGEVIVVKARQAADPGRAVKAASSHARTKYMVDVR